MIFTQLFAIYRVLSYPLILKTSLPEGERGIDIVLPMGLREVKQPVQGDTARRQQNQAENLGHLTSPQSSLPAATSTDTHYKANF